nr:ATP synthase F0 subunit 8 [Semimytilus algosus]
MVLFGSYSVMALSMAFGFFFVCVEVCLWWASSVGLGSVKIVGGFKGVPSSHPTAEERLACWGYSEKALKDKAIDEGGCKTALKSSHSILKSPYTEEEKLAYIESLKLKYITTEKTSFGGKKGGYWDSWNPGKAPSVGSYSESEEGRRLVEMVSDTKEGHKECIKALKKKLVTMGDAKFGDKSGILCGFNGGFFKIYGVKDKGYWEQWKTKKSLLEKKGLYKSSVVKDEAYWESLKPKKSLLEKKGILNKNVVKDEAYWNSLKSKKSLLEKSRVNDKSPAKKSLCSKGRALKKKK